MESSEDKTTRNIINYLTKYDWLYQYSIFIDVNQLEIEDAKDIAKNCLLTFDDEKFKDYLRKKKDSKDVAMMYVIRKGIHKNHSSKKRFQQFYITIFSTDRIQVLDDNLEYYSCDEPLNVMSRSVTNRKIESTCSALKKQKLHDISLLGSKKRFTILNKARLRLIEAL